ncbi:MAG: hypothetical protein ABUS54_04270, partial [Actinomycetota bacterium]
MIVDDPDLEDQVTAVYGVANGLTEQGFGAQLLAAPFRFDGAGSRDGETVYWIYGFKTGTFWPFVPKGDGQERDNARELGNGLAHLAGDRRECREALLHGRVVHEELADLLLPVGRDDEEGVHALHLAQVALRDERDPARDLLQRAHQVLRRAGDQGG